MRHRNPQRPLDKQRKLWYICSLAQLIAILYFPKTQSILKGMPVSQEYIEIRGARENNLRNISIRIPKRKITIFTGISGSGKSSIVFDTIATEAQRQLNENFSMFVRSFLPRYAQPEADSIENLDMAIA